ncbi:hypothetical protein MA16_Dca021704 [Dendrobium catenatum]|uniref:Uncharacterized protein n=1 Tax=Dendrobium catenatum TaxID=906689 RepID=A0A2I0W651_9ASPA|nr:hypothetical protein MA16_Dca021704 [Dendrobium catenatum]
MMLLVEIVFFYQMLQQYKDYNVGPPPLSVEELSLAIWDIVANKHFRCGGGGSEVVCQPQVSAECRREMNYLVVNVRSTDRLKLMFDTMCVMIDLDNDMFHVFVNIYGSVAIQVI